MAQDLLSKGKVLSADMEFDRGISSLALMVNGYYDFDTETAWKPFIGSGIGYALMQVEGWTTHHDDGVYAHQVMAGCGYSLSQKVTIDLQYRFYATEDPEFNTRDPDTARTTIERGYMTQSLMLGFRYFYWNRNLRECRPPQKPLEFPSGFCVLIVSAMQWLFFFFDGFPKFILAPKIKGSLQNISIIVFKSLQYR